MESCLFDALQKGKDICCILIGNFVLAIGGHDSRFGSTQAVDKLAMAHCQGGDDGAFTIVAVFAMAGVAVVHSVPSFAFGCISFGRAAPGESGGGDNDTENAENSKNRLQA